MAACGNTLQWMYLTRLVAETRARGDGFELELLWALQRCGCA